MEKENSVILKEVLDNTTFCIMGQKGSGKTYGMMYIGNAIYDKPVFYFDTLGAISRSGVCRCPNVVDVPRKFDVKALNRVFEDCLRRGGAIFNLSGLVNKELVQFADLFCQWAMQRRTPMALLVDEIADYCPQSKEYYSVELERVWRDGRNYGIRPVGMATQRPQKAHKDLLALSDVFILFRLFHNLDRSKVKDLLGLEEEEWENMEKQLMSLPTRHAYVFTTQLKLFKVVFPEMVRKNEVKSC